MHTNLFKAAILCSALVLFSCTKKKDKVPEEPAPVNTALKNGLPDNMRALNGYFYASSSDYGSGFYYTINLFAAFNDPAGDLINMYNHSNNNFFFNTDLLGNVRVGNITFNNSSFMAPSSFGPNSTL